MRLQFISNFSYSKIWFNIYSSNQINWNEHFYSQTIVFLEFYRNKFDFLKSEFSWSYVELELEWDIEKIGGVGAVTAEVAHLWQKYFFK